VEGGHRRRPEAGGGGRRPAGLLRRVDVQIEGEGGATGDEPARGGASGGYRRHRGRGWELAAAAQQLKKSRGGGGHGLAVGRLEERRRRGNRVQACGAGEGLRAGIC
jgi:hypothetical protein